MQMVDQVSLEMFNKFDGLVEQGRFELQAGAIRSASPFAWRSD